MSGTTHVIVVDTPSVKRFVFGTDALKEVRGASAMLDRLNRHEMETCLAQQLGVQQVEKVYANGDSAQFLAQETDDGAVEAACQIRASIEMAAIKFRQGIHGKQCFNPFFIRASIEIWIGPPTCAGQSRDSCSFNPFFIRASIEMNGRNLVRVEGLRPEKFQSLLHQGIN